MTQDTTDLIYLILLKVCVFSMFLFSILLCQIFLPPSSVKTYMSFLGGFSGLLIAWALGEYITESL